MKNYMLLVFIFLLTACSSKGGDELQTYTDAQIGVIELGSKGETIADFLKSFRLRLPDTLYAVGYAGDSIVEPEFGWATIFFKDKSSDCVATFQFVRVPELSKNVAVILRSIKTSTGASGRADVMRLRAGKVFSAMAAL